MWVSQPSTDNRQVTLQPCIRADGEQNVKPVIVFRGKGNVRAYEQAEYDEGVDVYYFQSCACMDSGLSSPLSANPPCPLDTFRGRDVLNTNVCVLTPKIPY